MFTNTKLLAKILVGAFFVFLVWNVYRFGEYLVFLHDVEPERAKFIAYLLGGGALFVQIYISSFRASSAEKTASAMQENVRLTEAGNIAERFKNAVEHLGDISASVRLGGVYALSRIAQETPDYSNSVLHILCAHIREITTQKIYRSRIEEYGSHRPTTEIQNMLYLLFGAQYGLTPRLKFYASLERADLLGADLSECDLKKAYLEQTNLTSTNLSYTNLQGAICVGANLCGALLTFTNFSECVLIHADLSESKNLKIEQLLEAKTLYQAKLPDGMEEEIRRLKPELLEKPVEWKL